MRWRDKVGLLVSPILIRLALGITFLWAGAGKFLGESEFSGRAADAVVELGITSPIDEEPDSTSEALNDQVVRARNVHHVSVTLYLAANPGFSEDSGDPLKATLPAGLGSGNAPVLLAWIVASVEVAAGICLLLGLLTRVAGISSVVVMAGAIWLTAIGPAIQSGETVLWILPDHGRFDAAWMIPLWQASLLLGSAAVALSGAGALSLDRIVFGETRVEEPDVDDEAD